MKPTIPLQTRIVLKWWFIKLLIGSLALGLFVVTWREGEAGKFTNPGYYQDAITNLFMAIVLAGIPGIVLCVPLFMFLKWRLFTDEERVFEKVMELRRFGATSEPVRPLAPRIPD